LKREKHETARNTRKAEAQSGLWCFGISMPKRARGLICVSSVFRHFNAERRAARSAFHYRLAESW